ncbi:MAG: helix-turn-helix transcriptional regulator [Rhizomicrobium sp.]
MPHLAIYLKTYRLKSALTQAELGELLGVSGDAVSKYERGLRNISVELLIVAKIIFGADPAEIIPARVDELEDALGRRALALHTRLAGRIDAGSQKKLALLERIPSRIRTNSEI